MHRPRRFPHPGGRELPAMAGIDGRRVDDERRHLVRAQPVVARRVEGRRVGEVRIVIGRGKGQLVHVERAAARHQRTIEVALQHLRHRLGIERPFFVLEDQPKRQRRLRRLHAAAQVERHRALEMRNQVARRSGYSCRVEAASCRAGAAAAPASSTRRRCCLPRRRRARRRDAGRSARRGAPARRGERRRRGSRRPKTRDRPCRRTPTAPPRTRQEAAFRRTRAPPASRAVASPASGRASRSAAPTFPASTAPVSARRESTAVASS